MRHLVCTINYVFALALPTLLQSIMQKADKWGGDGKTGMIDPFTDVFDVSVFLWKHTIRC